MIGDVTDRQVQEALAPGSVQEKASSSAGQEGSASSEEIEVDNILSLQNQSVSLPELDKTRGSESNINDNESKECLKLKCAHLNT